MISRQFANVEKTAEKLGKINKSGGSFMELQQEWYLREAKEAEDGKHHPPLKMKTRSGMPLLRETWTLYVKAAKMSDLRRRRVSASCPETR